MWGELLPTLGHWRRSKPSVDFLEIHPPYRSHDAPGYCTVLGVVLAMVVSRAENIVTFYRIL